MSSYANHIATVQARFDAALTATGFDSVLIYAGQPRVAFLDDNAAPYKVNPLFKYWIPVLESPKSAIYYKVGEKPVVFYFNHVIFGMLKLKFLMKSGNSTLS